MSKKRSGLNRKISSIFSGIPDIEDEISARESKPQKDRASSEEPSSSESQQPLSSTPSTEVRKNEIFSEDKIFLEDIRGGNSYQPPSDLTERKETPAKPGQALVMEQEKQGWLEKLWQWIYPDWFSGKRKTYIGIDMGFSSLKSACIMRVGKELVLSQLAEEEISATEKGVFAWEPALLKHLVEKIKEGREPGMLPEVILVVYGSSVYLSSFPLPKIPRKELAPAIRWELIKESPIPLDRAILDFYVKEESLGGRTQVPEVIAIACEENLILERLKQIKEAGLEADRINIVPLALENLLTNAKEKPLGEIVFLDLGATYSKACFFKDGCLQFSRELNIGGRNMTSALCTTLVLPEGRKEIEYLEAESIKRKYGMITETLSAEEKEARVAQILVLMRSVLEKLVNEIKRSFLYYREKFHVDKIERVFLTGGGAQLKGLEEYLARELETRVEKFEPLKELKISLGTHLEQKHLAEAGLFAVALGLALEEKPKINLLPAGYIPERKESFIRQIVKLSAVIFLALSFFGLLGLSFKEQGLKNSLAKAKKEATLLSPDIERFKNLESLGVAIDERRALLDKAIGREPKYGVCLRELGNIVPPNVILKELKILEAKKPCQMELQGIIYAGTLGLDSTLSKLLVELDKSPFFRKVELISSQKLVGEAAASFELTCELVY